MILDKLRLYLFTINTNRAEKKLPLMPFDDLLEVYLFTSKRQFKNYIEMKLKQ